MDCLEKTSQGRDRMAEIFDILGPIPSCPQLNKALFTTTTIFQIRTF